MMNSRLFGVVEERTLYDHDAKALKVIKTQHLDGMLAAIKERPDVIGMGGPARGKWLGTVPILIAQQWATECGHHIGSRGWGDYAKRKLKDGTWAKLRAK